MTQSSTAAGKKEWAQALPLVQWLAELADEVAEALHGLVQVSAIEERFPDDGGSIVVITPHPWRWAPLADSDVQKLRRGREIVQRWRRECVATLRAVAAEFEKDFLAEMDALDSIVDRSASGHGPGAPTGSGVLHYAHQAIAQQRETLRMAGISLGAQAGDVLLVPDTNALYANPYLDEWEGTSVATVVVVPQVNRELDKHKNEADSSARKEKAELVIRQFDEFARRGDTLTGVRISGSLRYREESVDIEPDADDDLQVDNDDDRVLANALHVRRRHPDSPVVLVTRDQNLKAKARRHRLTTDVPPPPRKPFAPRGSRKPPPEVMLGHPGGQVSTTPLHELGDGEHSALVAVKPRYFIENKGPISIRDVTTGVRTRDGREHRFEDYRAQLVGAGESSEVANVGSVPSEFLEGVHESAAFGAFIFWARFTDRDGTKWEVAYDPGSRDTNWLELK